MAFVDVGGSQTDTRVPNESAGYGAEREDVLSDETRSNLTCLGSDTPYASESELCGASEFIGAEVIGGDVAGTPMERSLGAMIDSSAETCACNYTADYCFDDVDFRDNFETPGTLDDGDNWRPPAHGKWLRWNTRPSPTHAPSAPTATPGCCSGLWSGSGRSKALGSMRPRCCR